jgi:hypothetical protein
LRRKGRAGGIWVRNLIKEGAGRVGYQKIHFIPV